MPDVHQICTTYMVSWGFRDAIFYDFLWFSHIFSHFRTIFSTGVQDSAHFVLFSSTSSLFGAPGCSGFPMLKCQKMGDPPKAGFFFLMENPWKIGWWGFRFVMGVPQNWYVFFHGKSMKILTFGWFGGTPSSPSSLDGWFHWGYPLNFGNTHIRKWMVYDGTSIYKMDDLEWYPDLASWISQRAMIRQKRQIFHKTTNFGIVHDIVVKPHQEKHVPSGYD